MTRIILTQVLRGCAVIRDVLVLDLAPFQHEFAFFFHLLDGTDDGFNPKAGHICQLLACEGYNNLFAGGMLCDLGLEIADNGKEPVFRIVRRNFREDHRLVLKPATQYLIELHVDVEVVA